MALISERICAKGCLGHVFILSLSGPFDEEFRMGCEFETLGEPFIQR